MDDDVRREYETLYRRSPDRYEMRSWIDQVSEEVKRETGRRLRPDAGYLLLINFTAMVIRPADRAKKVSVDEFREVAKNDIRVIVREAAIESEADEISGHQVINALTRTWGQLKTMAYNVWD